MPGGTAEFAAGRAAAERAYAARPGGLDGVRADARRAVLGRIVRYLARGHADRQFPDIGTGIPKEDNVHEVAQREAPESRLVHVDRDPIVLAHANQLRGAAWHDHLSSTGSCRRPGFSACQRVAVKAGFSPAGSVSRVVEASGEVAEDLRYIFRSG